jgi:ribulose-phosphate 3-epimerase
MHVHPRADWEAHLMVSQPIEYFTALAQAGARRIIVHYEAAVEPLTLVEMLHALGVEAGLAINPDTPVSAIDETLAAALDYVLFMSVYPGFYGKPFIPEVLEKVSEFKRLYPGKAVGIDGGIKMENIAMAARAGADEICVGSAIFAAGNPAESYRSLTDRARTAWNTLDAKC